MEKHVISSLRDNKTVAASFIRFVNAKGYTADEIISRKFALNNMDLFMQFFTGIYKLDIICRPDTFSVRKSGTNVIDITAETSYENLFMLLIIALFNYCENPF